MEFPSRLKPTKWAPLACADSPMDNADFFLEFDSLLKWVNAGSDSPSPRATYADHKCRDSPAGSDGRASRQRVWPRAPFKPLREGQPISLNELERLLRKADRNRQIHPTKDVARKLQHTEICRENLKRKRAKEKIQDLKVELIELEKSLLRLQQQTNENVSDDVTTSSTHSSTHPALYQDRVESKRRKQNPKIQPKGEKHINLINLREQREREEAEIENAELRDAAHKQRHITRVMEVALHEIQPILVVTLLLRSVSLMLETTCSLCVLLIFSLTMQASISKQSQSNPDHPDAECIFDGLGRNLDSQYQQIDAIWKACGLANVNIDIQSEERIAKDESGAALLEHVHARVSPFSVDALTRIMWRATKRGIFTPTDGEMKVCKAMGNTLYITVADTLHIEKLSAAAVNVNTHLVLKRFIDKHRVVFVWESAVEMDGAVTTRLTEHGWHMLRDASLSKNMVACISQTYARVSPACGTVNCFKDQSADREMIVAVQEISHRNVEMLQQIAENQLMDESLEAPKESHE